MFDFIQYNQIVLYILSKRLYYCVIRYSNMSYCIKCFAPADVCFCETKKVPLSEYTHEMKECTDLKCYCKEHIPKIDS